MIVSMTMSLIVRMGIFALLWWVLTEGTVASWWMGGLVVLLAALISVRMTSPQSLSFKGFCQFVPFFIWHSLKGSIDVAWRALRPNMAIAPVLVTYRLRLPRGAAQIFMTNVLNLLPGTLAADLEKSVLTVHVLDGRGSYQSELALLEQKIAALFHVSLRATAHAAIPPEGTNQP